MAGSLEINHEKVLSSYHSSLHFRSSFTHVSECNNDAFQMRQVVFSLQSSVCCCCQACKNVWWGKVHQIDVTRSSPPSDAGVSAVQQPVISM